MITEELAELFLCHLYDLAEAAPHPNFLFSVNDFAPSYGVTNVEELQKAINHLGDRGLIILAGFDVLGGVSAGITMEGSIFVENGGETGAIPRYRKNPSQFIVDSPSPLFPPTPLPETTPLSLSGSKPSFPFNRSVDAILLDLEDAIRAGDELTDDTKNDYLADVSALRSQLARRTKNPESIRVLTLSLPDVQPLVPLVKALVCLIEPYVMR
jgi:hypothetical protein